MSRSVHNSNKFRVKKYFKNHFLLSISTGYVPDLRANRLESDTHTSHAKPSQSLSGRNLLLFNASECDIWISSEIIIRLIPRCALQRNSKQYVTIAHTKPSRPVCLSVLVCCLARNNANRFHTIGWLIAVCVALCEPIKSFTQTAHTSSERFDASNYNILIALRDAHRTNRLSYFIIHCNELKTKNKTCWRWRLQNNKRKLISIMACALSWAGHR